MSETVTRMTEAQATDEAVLLFTRKLRRLHTAAFQDIWRRLPDGAKEAIYAAERRADQLRDATGGADRLGYPVDEEPDEDSGEE
jgi:hypothetical protein